MFEIAVGTTPPLASDPAWSALTFPLYRPLLAAPGDAGAVVATAVVRGEPVGLALARRSGRDAALLSVAVAPLWRGLGVASQLLPALEQELRAEGCALARVTFMSGLPSTAAVEALLRRGGWSVPEPRMVACRTDIDLLARAPWVREPPRAPGAEVFAWSELGRDDRARLEDEQAARPFYPGILSPFAEEATIEPLNSLGLHRGGRIEGWMITHRIAPDGVRYTKLFLRPGSRAAGHGLLLSGLAVRRHAESGLAAAAPRCFCDLEAGNLVMWNFFRKRLRPYVTFAAVTKGSHKVLSPARQQGEVA